jgi:hypothetical protein
MCLDKHLAVVNFATEPVTARQLSRQVFARSITNELPAPPPRYDFHTLHADAFGRTGPYIASRDEVLSAMKRFVEATRAAKK